MVLTIIIVGVVLCLAAVAGFWFLGQVKKTHTFTNGKLIPVSPVRYQGKTRLCWVFSGIAMLEAEQLRKGHAPHKLSELYLAYHGYMDRALSASNPESGTVFDPGGCCGDFIHCIAEYGLVPEKVMPCPTALNHRPYKPLIQEMAGQIAQARQSGDKAALDHAQQQLEQFLQDSLGVPPNAIQVNEDSLSPQEYLQSLDINPNDYVQLTSFTHHPFYKPFAIECPDNWRHDLAYNLPIDELMAVMDNAIECGYTFCWEGDISEFGFRFHNPKGFIKRFWPWQHMVSQRQRQCAWDHHRTTDDHVMLICGKAHDERGRDYYLVKNCWGAYGPYAGFVYMSKAYARYKVVNILVHRDAIPIPIRQKLEGTMESSFKK
ncbi:MAG: hypothetical protein MJZ67_07850 [Bacteroidales bacterium]|nr:hypothetical protein [Bacteroidales bacterium]